MLQLQDSSTATSGNLLTSMRAPAQQGEDTKSWAIIVYICARFIASVRFGVVHASGVKNVYVKPHGSDEYVV
jgi:hypothetical protein